MSNLHIIAEAGTNHNASSKTAKKLIDVAVESGADSVKFQIIYPEGLYVSKIYQDGVCRENEVIAIRRAGMLQDEDYLELATYSEQKGMPLSASVFCEKGLSLLDRLEPPYIKIASCDLNNSLLLHKAAELGHKLIVSTGMASLKEIEQAVKEITANGFNDLVLMHCVSVYPCPTGQMNLGFLQTLKQEFGFPIGLSDHTENSLAAAVAVSMGVSWIEKHYTLDRSSEGFDHAYAMEPDMLKQYIMDVRMVEQACRSPVAKVGESESNVKIRARRGLYASRDIGAGEVISIDDVVALRPESEFSPQQAGVVIGKVAGCDIKQFEGFSASALKGTAVPTTPVKTA
ncbi:MAG: N-acetylneuraminate synthase family protein [Planctomycetota bacterium]|nr:N-acetylneuraminate synthase family protein [Planctomycetota bacterium]